jgi:NADPH-dependent ferric siderophore reductase
MPSQAFVSPEAERLAEAGQVLAIYGERAPLFVAERLGTLDLQGDAAGIARWKAIAEALAHLMKLKAPH